MTGAGLFSYLVFFLTFAGIYALLVQGLNVQWGFAGMLNVGVAAFFAIGAYSSAILTTPGLGRPSGRLRPALARGLRRSPWRSPACSA